MVHSYLLNKKNKFRIGAHICDFVYGRRDCLSSNALLSAVDLISIFIVGQTSYDYTFL